MSLAVLQIGKSTLSTQLFINVTVRSLEYMSTYCRATHQLICTTYVDPVLLKLCSNSIKKTIEQNLFFTILLQRISGFRCKVDKICALLGYYAAYSGNSLPTFRDNLSLSHLQGSRNAKGIGFSDLEDGTYRLSRNVGKELPLYGV